jgi:hypothetical protein
MADGRRQKTEGRRQKAVKNSALGSRFCAKNAGKGLFVRTSVKRGVVVGTRFRTGLVHSQAMVIRDKEE